MDRSDDADFERWTRDNLAYQMRKLADATDMADRHNREDAVRSYALTLAEIEESKVEHDYS
jgi:hypothetical protein